MKFWSIFLITLIVLPATARADLTTLGPTEHLNIDASAQAMVGLSATEVIAQTGASSYVPLNGKLKARLEYYTGLFGIGASLGTERDVNEEAKNPGRFDIDIDLAFALINEYGKVVAITGSFGFRNQSERQHFGNAFVDGYKTTTNDVMTYKAGAKINVLLPIINGQIKVMFLPVLDRWEIEAEIKIKLNKILTRYDINLGFVDNVIIEFNNSAPLTGQSGNNAILGRVYLFLEKAIISLDSEPGGGGVYFFYGAGVEWNSNQTTPNVIISIGVKIKI